MNNKTFIIITLILAITAIISMAAYLSGKFESSSEAQMADFPKEIGDWSATEIPLGQNEYKNLGTRNIMMRNYQNRRGASIILYIIYSRKDREVAYPPEVYYLGSGKTIVKKSIEQITPAIKAVKMLLEQGDNQQILAYWFRSGELNTENYIKQQFKIVTDHMFFKRTSGAMLSLSVDIKKNNEPAAFKTLQEFASLIEPLLEKYVP